MDIRFFYAANAVLLSRLIFTFRDKPITVNQTRAMIAIQTLALMAFEFDIAFIALAASLAITNIVFYNAENKQSSIYESRLISLFISLFIISVFSSDLLKLNFHENWQYIVKYLAGYSSAIQLTLGLNWLRASILIFGLLLVTNEANILIRLLFKIFQLEPKKEAKDPETSITELDEKEYNAGRVIGILERILVYYLVLNLQFTAIGFIIAAKSFARFKELEKREYAEYVLIGTLASTIIALFIAAAVHKLITLTVQ